MARPAARKKAPRRDEPLGTYRKKRDFTKTPEPEPKVKSSRSGNSYLIQKHAATRLHYDFRLELNGVLLSWAVPKGPSLDPAERRLAARTEDHPLDYGGFEGIIPAGEYGGGTVMLWDRGTWSWTKDPQKWIHRGQLEFELHGERLKGGWILTRLKPKPDERGDKENWLLIKRNDEFAKPGAGSSLVDVETTSVVTGRTMEEIASERDRVWSSHVGEVSQQKGSAPSPRQNVGGSKTLKKLAVKGKRSNMPDFIPPQLATLASKAPIGDKWVHEIKLDGYRTEARLEGGKVRMLTRSGLDWTSKFTPIAKEIARLDVESALLDGEIVVNDEAGVSSFANLQQALSEGKTSGLVYHVFDLLYLEGRDLRSVPLLDRKAALAELLSTLPESSVVKFSDHFLDRGPEVFQHACRMALEGIVSKRADAPYVSGRGKTWLKIKCALRQEFVVGGWLSSTAAGRDLRSVLVGYFDKGKFRYAGKIGTGFNEKNSAKLLDALKKHSSKEAPFVDLPKGVAKGVHWVKPAVVVEAEFATWTRDRIIRHASFEGQREDKDAESVRLEVPDDEALSAESPVRENKAGDYAGVKLTNPDRILWPDAGVSKEALADYYETVSELMLPHIINRPVSIIRCPEGIKGQCFFQRHMGQGLPEAVKPVKVRNEKEPYIAIYDKAGLFSLVQFSALEIHPWGSRADEPEHPDRIIMDFDPSEELPWSTVVEAGFECRDRLKDLGLTSFVKTTGGKGLHVVIPIQPKHDWPEVKAFALALASAMAADNNRYLTQMAKSARKGRIFIDYLRNDRTSTAIAPYSTRARPGAAVAIPVDWSELRALPSGRMYTVTTIGRRLASLSDDPWEDIGKVKQTLSTKAKRALGMKL